MEFSRSPSVLAIQIILTNCLAYLLNMNNSVGTKKSLQNSTSIHDLKKKKKEALSMLIREQLNLKNNVYIKHTGKITITRKNQIFECFCLRSETRKYIFSHQFYSALYQTSYELK
jgi:hypothetical protein